jgi:hypothetical protein
MIDDSGGNRGSRRAGFAAAMAGVALLAAACGGSPSTSTSGLTNYQKALAYSQCIRAHGVPNFPDPNSNGQIIQSANGTRGSGDQNVSSTVMQAANKACQHLLPNGGQVTPAQRQQVINQMLKYSQCMRSHGVPNFPDPSTSGTGGEIALNFHGTGIDPKSPRLQAANRACQSLRPGPPGSGK